MTDWHIEPLDSRRVSMKRRRSSTCEPQPLDVLPTEWRVLLTRWARRGGNSRWETLRKDAGINNIQLAEDLLKHLLQSNWAIVVEERQPNDLNTWWPKQVELLHLSKLRTLLGLRDTLTDIQRWEKQREQLRELNDAELYPALNALEELPAQRALTRCDLLFKLHEWSMQRPSGTRRDFALFARGDTKAVSNAEWDWLESVLDLSSFGIERHTPLLLISAPLTLHTARGQIDLAAFGDFAALTPATLNSVLEISGSVAHWRLIENRTSFERVARQTTTETGVVWLPGFPPSWWKCAIARLLDLAPASAQIACDPDPAGISIALQTAKLWTGQKLDWEPWKMSSADLASLPMRKPLTEMDRQRLASLQTDSHLPPTLAELAEWMAQHGEKGEQEGYL